MKKISSCLWFDGQAEEAAQFYTSLFKNSKIGRTARYGESAAEVSGQKKNAVMTVEFELEGLKVLALNGGPLFKFSPSLSFFVWCESEKEIEELWNKLAEGGHARMALDKYPWAEKYGWTSDKYGVEWQLMLKSHSPKIAPAFLFVDELFGKGEEAIGFYHSVFKNSKTEIMARDEATKSIMHCIFSLEGQNFVLMEGSGKHGHVFTNAFSIVVTCDTKEEIDELWSKLSKEGTVEQCGWLKDKYGVSWQIVPRALAQLMTDKDPKKSEKVMQAMLQMKKLNIETLNKAYAQ